MDDKVQIIDIFGQFQDKGSGHYYTYPAMPQEETVEWKRFINDPRELPASLSQPVYAIWCTPRGWWVAQVQHNPNDSRGGFAMASLFLGANRPTDGAQVVQVLQKVAAQYIDNMNWDDNTLAEEVTSDGALSLEPCKVRQFSLGQPSAFRTYGSTEELEDALTLICHKDYQAYSRVFVLPQDADVQSLRMTDVSNSIPLREDSSQLAHSQRGGDSSKFTVVFELDGVLSMEASEKISKSAPAYTLLTNQYMVRPSGHQLHVNVPRPHATIYDNDPRRSEGWTWQQVAALVIGLLFAGFSLYVMACLTINRVPWPFRLSADALVEEVAVHDEDVVSDEAEDDADAVVVSAEEQKAIDHDLTYLFNANAWQRDALQSEHFIALYDILKAGDIEALRGQDWFEGVDSMRINPRWKIVQKCVNTIEGHDNEIIKLLSESRDKNIEGDNVAIDFMASQLKSMSRASQNKPNPAPQKVATPAPKETKTQAKKE